MSLITDLINLPQFTPGRVLFALKQVPPIEHPEIAAAIDAAQAAAAQCSTTNAAWAAQRAQGTARGKAAEIDARIDRTLGSLAAILRAQINALAADDPQHTAAAALLERAFPRGVPAIVTLPFEDELLAVKELLGRLDDQADAVASLGVAGMVAQLQALVPQFEAELVKADQIDFGTVRAHRAALQRALTIVVVRMLGAHADPAEDAALGAALAPILEQAERLKALRRARRRVSDVDPQTGVEEIEG